MARDSIPTELVERALRGYGAALAVTDPIRIKFWDDRGLTMTQLRMMFLIQRGHGTVGELAEQMRVRPATITGLTDRLVRHQLIERKEDSRDRRVVRVELTGEGSRVLVEIREASRIYLTEILEMMGLEACQRLVEAFESFSAAAAAFDSSHMPDVSLGDSAVAVGPPPVMQKT